ncbi:MAG TPA: hypothetical protein VI033_00175, partial [Candidatus Nitrosopolaris sp.]
RTTKANGKISAKSTSLVIEWATNPLTEFVSINKLAEAAAVFGFARPVNIKIGDNQIPPPIPTRPETVPRIAPNGNVINESLGRLRFNFRIFSCLIFIWLPLNSSMAEAEKREITKINTRSFSGSTTEPAIKANGTEISNGIEIRSDK